MESLAGVLWTHRIAIGMDGKGRALDNVLLEGLWRAVKYEHLYLSPAANGAAAMRLMGKHTR